MDASKYCAICVNVEIRDSIGCENCSIFKAFNLTYAITLLMHLQTLKEPLSYTRMSAIRASAQDSADEYYRAVMSKYEDTKRAENGSVSSLDSTTPDYAVET